MAKEKKKRRFKPQVYYPGGTKAMSRFIHGHLKYPEEAADHEIVGTVRLRLDIDHKGKVMKSKIMSSLGYGCDEEAQRVVLLLKFETEYDLRKSRVLFHKTLNVHFRPPKKKLPPKQVLNYRMIPEKDKEKEPPRTGYTYTIEI